MGLTGFAVSQANFSNTNSVEHVYLRKGLENKLGSSSVWYPGVGDWLFTGNHFQNTVAKLQLAYEPDESEVSQLRQLLENLASVGYFSGTKIGLIIAPNKSSVYSDKIPPKFKVSPVRYIDFFIDDLKSIENLNVYDPTRDLIQLRDLEGHPYFRTDSHWNHLGAYFTLKNMLVDFDHTLPALHFRPAKQKLVTC